MNIRDELVAAPRVPLRYLVRMNPRPRVLKASESCYLPMEAISEFGPADSSRSRPTSELAQGYSYIADGDVAYAKVTPCFENGKGLRAAGLPGGYAFATTEITVMRPGKDLDSRYLAWLLQSEEFRAPGESRMSGAGGLKRVPDSYAASYRIPHPCLEAQRGIADYLDRETAQIDAFIAKNEELITLLAERRAAAVDRAVAWGAAAHEDAEGWFGGVPAGWSLAPLRRWVRFITSGSRGWGQFYSDQGADIFLRIGDLQRDRLDLRAVERQRVNLPAGEEGVRAQAQDGDLLISITADLGSVAVIRESDAGAYVSQHVALVRIDRERLNPRFAAYAVSSSAGKTHFEKAAYGGTKIQLSLPDVKEMPIAVPPLNEQNRIVELLDSVTEDVDDAIATASKAIDLARERRAALISAAVTGKIDVGVMT